MWTVLEWVYWTGFSVLMLIHLCRGNFTASARYIQDGRVVFRFPGFFAALIFSLGWPIILPMQLAQNR